MKEKTFVQKFINKQLLIFVIVSMLYSCTNNKKAQPISIEDSIEVQESATEDVYEQSKEYMLEQKDNNNETFLEEHSETVISQPIVTIQQKKEPASNSEEQYKPLKKIRISRAYQLGYDRGYEDGEDDALTGNGWEGQFDDSNNFKGQAKKDYELGYCEGYEAGYDDNFEGTDD